MSLFLKILVGVSLGIAAFMVFYIIPLSIVVLLEDL